jgi:hypothetical protein
MATLTVNGLAYTELYESINGATYVQGRYHAHGVPGMAPSAGAPIYRDVEVEFPGVDGIGVIRFGFRGRPLYMALCWVGTESYCQTTQKSDMDTLTQLARYSVTLPNGATFPGCRLFSDGPPSWFNLSGAVCCWQQIVVRQMSLSN